MTLIEKMARAMCEAEGLDWDKQAHFMTSAGGSDDEQSEWIHRATAALAAAREPSEEMVEAGTPYSDGGAFWAIAGWQAMIDAALKEQG